MKQVTFEVNCEVEINGEKKTGSVQANYDAFESLPDAIKFYTVKVTVKNGKDVETILSPEDATARLLEDLNKTRKNLAHSKAYADLKSTLEGPDKALEKVAKTYMDNANKFRKLNNKPEITLEEALETLKKNPDILEMFGMQAA